MNPTLLPNTGARPFLSPRPRSPPSSLHLRQQVRNRNQQKTVIKRRGVFQKEKFPLQRSETQRTMSPSSLLPSILLLLLLLDLFSSLFHFLCSSSASFSLPSFPRERRVYINPFSRLLKALFGLVSVWLQRPERGGSNTRLGEKWRRGATGRRAMVVDRAV